MRMFARVVRESHAMRAMHAMRTLPAARLIRVAAIVLAMTAVAPVREGRIRAAVNPAPQKLWERRIVRLPSVPPALQGDRLFVAGPDRKILCYDARNGKRLWKRALPGHVGYGIVAADSALLVGLSSPSPGISVLDPRTGRIRWARRLEGMPAGIVRFKTSVVVLEFGGILRSLGLGDGKERWQQKLKGPMSGMALDGTNLAILARRDSLWSVSVEDGTRSWVVPTSGTHPSPPVIAGGMILRLTYEGELVAHEPSTGAEIAGAAVPKDQIAPLGVIDGSWCAAVSTGGDVAAFGLPYLNDAWSARTGQTVMTGAVRFGSLWIVGCENGQILGLDARDGTIIWTEGTPAPITMRPAVSGDKIAIVDDGGRAFVYSDSGAATGGVER
jgi:outer membrane protein assembly factor BamB